MYSNDSEDEARLREPALKWVPPAVAAEAALSALRHSQSSGPGSLQPRAQSPEP